MEVFIKVLTLKLTLMFSKIGVQVQYVWKRDLTEGLKGECGFVIWWFHRSDNCISTWSDKQEQPQFVASLNL